MNHTNEGKLTYHLVQDVKIMRQDFFVASSNGRETPPADGERAVIMSQWVRGVGQACWTEQSQGYSGYPEYVQESRSHVATVSSLWKCMTGCVKTFKSEWFLQVLSDLKLLCQGNVAIRLTAWTKIWAVARDEGTLWWNSGLGNRAVLLKDQAKIKPLVNF